MAIAIFALGAGVCAAQPSGAAKTDAKASAAESAKAAAKSAVKQGPTGSNLESLRKQISAQRDTMVANHDALAKQLKDATEADKKAIKERMEAQMKQFEARQAALHKEIRDEQRRLRTQGGR